jgi:hypothetical protein
LITLLCLGGGFGGFRRVFDFGDEPSARRADQGFLRAVLKAPELIGQ